MVPALHEAKIMFLVASERACRFKDSPITDTPLTAELHARDVSLWDEQAVAINLCWPSDKLDFVPTFVSPLDTNSGLASLVTQLLPEPSPCKFCSELEE